MKISELATVRRFFSLLAVVVVLAVAGCGGGGGGGGGGGSTTTPPDDNDPPPVEGVSPPTQSNWSPAKNSTIAAKSTTVIFSTNVTASCRWALTDLAYSQMSANCSGSGTKTHSCSVSGLSEGSAGFFISCRGSDGGEDTASTNESISYTVDTIAPSISVTYPATAQEFANRTRPDYVSVSYSDSGSGIDVSELAVSFTLQGRAVDITDLFGTDPVDNASESRTPASNTDPLSRTTVSRFASVDLANPVRSWSIGRSGDVTLKILEADAQRAFLWDTQGTSVWLLDASSGSITEFTPFASNPLDVVVSAASKLFYAVFSGDTTLYGYYLSDGSFAGTAALSGAPFNDTPDRALAYNSILDKLYVSFDTLQQVGVWNSSTAGWEASFSLDHIPSFISAWETDTDRLVTVSWAGDARVNLYNSSSVRLISTIVDAQVPEDLLADTGSGYIFAAAYEDPGRVVAVNATTGAKEDITVGSLPFRLFHGAAGEAVSVSDDTGDISVINTSNRTVSSPVSVATPVSDGVYLSGPAAYFIAEDVWKLPDRIPCTITATVQDAAGNPASGQVTIYVAPGIAGRFAAR